MNQNELILLVSAAQQLYRDGHRELGARVNAAVKELGTDYASLVDGLFTAMTRESASAAAPHVVATAARFRRDWPHLAKAVDALMRTAIIREFPFVELADEHAKPPISQPWTEFPSGRWYPPEVTPLTPDEEQQKANRRLGVHLSHCNFGEYANRCKYGEDADCPALSESWSWFGKIVQERDRLRDIDLPAEPTQEMLDAAHDTLAPLHGHLGFDVFRKAYRAMLGAAPTKKQSM